MPPLHRLPTRKAPWLLLAASALLLELCALYFQYVMGLEPCVLCVYERTAVAGILAGALIGASAPHTVLARLAGFTLWIGGAAWGLGLALEHMAIQAGGASCDFLANYPDWFSLDRWLPWMFEPRGFCDEIQWTLFGYSMPQTLVPIYALYLGIAAIILLSRLRWHWRSRHA
ncbi:MAG: disulfide bond formation protein B [Candidatus Sedimenticola endophacoides]|uniref:Disulfide bond formation protein B n=1 Tax=Candidatus Sedimenticola endophacoides TaxID=2548426 RepID=A0A657PLU9_9GAMM|nr:MAG: disulfide bond formation protein B [Candidatus Sedimenticola endophacoides]OQX32728.1 MAG: disulfide bond formation protein B [Candidatus Sedimenticola endophacoides]OQX37803.1 MAG: disulfide bond formation protein B [Candidatus Sedimenticola endophacoides]OQX42750.1 MAG: disulfide bond formation protein B [Candidatus Sedimenticola endophacoides]PUE01687.1 MAG: disulfide bond formation protein DsbB [Candidatus Sedimenticola endophacoides]